MRGLLVGTLLVEHRTSPRWAWRKNMGEIASVSEVRVEWLGGPGRAAYLPGEDEPIIYGMHGAIAERYGAQPGQFPRHASTIDHLVGAALG